MNLSAEQVAAAEAAGCRFLPAPADALHRFAMQRKLFHAGGREVLATRGGGLYETASTLERLIAEGLKLLPASPRAMPEPGPSQVAEPEPSQVAEPQPPAMAEPPPAPKRRRARPASAMAPADPAPASPEPPESEPALPAGPRAAATAIPPRSRRHHAEPPRWSTAGAARRGRATVHWSTRVR
ncbi:MAG: hypothetical protein K2X49_06300 [Acetobacteraceae bacterium]|nr:hypothetical protein [Acetobacteraceae bacterium]